MELSDLPHSTSLPADGVRVGADAPRLCDWSLGLVERHWRWLLAGILLVHLVGFNGQWRVERDSALYLTVARSLAEGQGFTYHDQPNHLIFPGLPVVVAGIFRACHTESATPILVAMLLASWATLGLTYRLFSLYAGRSAGIVIMLGVGLTRLFYRYSFEVLSDLPFLMGVMAFLAGYEAIFFAADSRDQARFSEPHRVRWFDYALLVIGLLVALSMRVVVWVVLAAIIASALMRFRRGRLRRIEISVIASIAIGIVAFYFIRMSGSRGGEHVEGYEGTLLSMMLHGRIHAEQLRENLRDLFPRGAVIKALFGCGMLPILNTLIGLLIVGLGIGLLTRRAIWGWLVIFTVATLLIFKPLDRYFLPVIPLLVFAWWKFLVALNHRLPGKWGDMVYLCLFMTGLGTNIARIGEMVVEQRRQPFLEHYHEGRYASVPNVAEWLGRSTNPHDWILVGPTHGRILTYASRRNVFEPTEPPAITPSPDHFLMMTGPSWDETKEGRHKEARLRDVSQAERDRMAEWLMIMSLERGPLVAELPRGPSDLEPWRLYRLVPRTQ